MLLGIPFGIIATIVTVSPTNPSPLLPAQTPQEITALREPEQALAGFIDRMRMYVTGGGASGAKTPFVITPIGHEVWLSYLEKRKALLQETITLHLPPALAEGAEISTWTIPLRQNADWIIRKRHDPEGTATLDPAKVQAFLDAYILPQIDQPEHVRITAMPTSGTGSYRAAVDGRARDGWVLHDGAIAEIVHAVEQGQMDNTIPLTFIRGRIINETSADLGDMILLARGRSNFTGSHPNRVFNIQKAFHDYVSGVLIPPGGIFSFNELLGDDVEISGGWKMSLGIFENGEELRPTAGGGICQASTTTYRALAAAGVPVLEKSNHSKYVSYYRDYGEGLDAAIYPGSKNLVAMNDSPGYLFFQAYTVDNDAYVDIYGLRDRLVTLEGPYRYYNIPDDLTHKNGAHLGAREIGWRQTIAYPDGRVESALLFSHFSEDIPMWVSERAGKLPVVPDLAKLLSRPSPAAAPATEDTQDSPQGEGA